VKPANAVRLQARIVGVSVAVEACARHHRHLPRVVGGLVGVEVVRSDTRWPCAWGIVGRAVARVLDADGWVELTRGIVPDGAPPNCASAVIAAAARWAKEQGRQIVSYTLAHEPGTSYRAAGWFEVGRVRARQWRCNARPCAAVRVGHVGGEKRRWVPAWAVEAAMRRGWPLERGE
jgi:hypothetical protein